MMFDIQRDRFPVVWSEIAFSGVAEEDELLGLLDVKEQLNVD